MAIISRRKKAIGMALMAMLLMVGLVALTPSGTSAGVITVDGYDEAAWAGAKCATDPGWDLAKVVENVTYLINFSSGYDLRKFCALLDSGNDTLYVKIETNGTAGDTDGDGDPNNSSNHYWPIDDSFEVGEGEWYEVYLDVDGNGARDHTLIYNRNEITMENFPGGIEVNGTTAGSIGASPYTNTVVEMCFSPLHNLSGYGVCDTDFRVKAYIGNALDGFSEDETGYFSLNQAPVPVIHVETVYCSHNVTFNGSASYDPDGNITNWTWNFGDGTVGYGEVIEHYYDAVKAYTVVLTVTDDYGFACSSSTIVMIYPCSQQVPILSTVGVIGLLGALSVIASRGLKQRRRGT